MYKQFYNQYIQYPLDKRNGFILLLIKTSLARPAFAIPSAMVGANVFRGNNADWFHGKKDGVSGKKDGASGEKDGVSGEKDGVSGESTGASLRYFTVLWKQVMAIFLLTSPDR